ncbi:hypothetical protein PHYBLDRAFT_63450 [Phycomyces blakesleeanus NRRL 1555(-)]|uniref:Homeodomain-like DNA binding domain-containing transcription factor n=1 Tax=Phycomyces blakesleeanus (strain ATCC 8743b / DSM 1359 / FGSC 10004 / NBRC 33097 / NRRL 1555) TaxID=763407 RepID=A0A162NDX0_PHYB8|nr:hypothetical protein PHYBLDRAFT_63450 [Phycomyces blakesleeanus NRRL 1555(-)]OAD68644.1 hypothetical protein PHYBLDRAFT_63450 [Phycomyces blakesleeanus NRRL 1555(-)]|eukprot:XP_018286684.1 hypothetical protein PHYBLDRAFT_63450 [Phycomyces blakesleeanus NRRL 1555(-)]
MFDNCNQIGRECISIEEHKRAVVESIGANSSATIVEVTEHLLRRFSDLKVSHSTVYNFMRCECNLSIKKGYFNSIERDSPAKIEERYDWVCKGENTDINFLTNCGFLDKFAFDISLERSGAWPKKKGARCYCYQAYYKNKHSINIGCYFCRRFDHRRRKEKPRPVKNRNFDGYISSGTVIGHYISFLKSTLDEMYKNPHIKGGYIVIILSNEDIRVYIFLLILLKLIQLKNFEQ